MYQMSAGREFRTGGPATENARSPNLVKVGGTLYKNVSIEERSPCRRVLSTCGELHHADGSVQHTHLQKTLSHEQQHLMTEFLL